MKFTINGEERNLEHVVDARITYDALIHMAKFKETDTPIVNITKKPTSGARGVGCTMGRGELIELEDGMNIRIVSTDNA